MLLQVQVIIEAQTSARVYLKILFIKIQLYPQKKKPPKLKDYSPKRIAKRAEKKKKKLEAKLKKKAKKEQKKKKKSLQNDANNAVGSQKPKKKMSVSDVVELVSLVLELSKTFFVRFGRRLRLDLTKIHITVGGEDAAKTALTYGAVSAGVSSLCELLDSIFTVKPKGNKDVIVDADFLSETIAVDIIVSASLRVWHALDIALAVAISFVKKKILNK
jgi:hypothetical protein